MTQICKTIAFHPHAGDPVGGGNSQNDPTRSASGCTSSDRMGCCEGVRICLNPEFFRALCDPTRIALIVELARRPEPTTVSEIGCCCDVDLSVVSRHLKMLRDAGIAESEKRGKEVRYSIRYDDVVRTLRALADAIEQCCPARGDACCKQTPVDSANNAPARTEPPSSDHAGRDSTSEGSTP